MHTNDLLQTQKDILQPVCVFFVGKMSLLLQGKSRLCEREAYLLVLLHGGIWRFEPGRGGAGGESQATQVSYNSWENGKKEKSNEKSKRKKVIYYRALHG